MIASDNRGVPVSLGPTARLGAANGERGAESREQRAESRGKGAESREKGAESRRAAFRRRAGEGVVGHEEGGKVCWLEASSSSSKWNRDEAGGLVVFCLLNKVTAACKTEFDFQFNLFFDGTTYITIVYWAPNKSFE